MYALMAVSYTYSGVAPWLVNALFAILLTTFAVAVVFLPARELWMRRRGRRDLLFADRVPGVREFAVEIVVKSRGKEVGADRGVVWFEPGLLGFTGERTSFLLAYEDLQPPSRWTLTEIDRPFAPLQLRLDGGRVRVTVRPMWGQGWGYRRGLGRFLRERAPTDAARQWPPTTGYAPELPER